MGRAPGYICSSGYLLGCDVTLTAAEHRSQLRNREAAAARLAALIAGAVATPPKARRATKPSRGSVERRIAEKKRRSQTKRNRRPDHD